MCKKDGLVVVAVPEVGQHCRDVGALVAAWEALRVGNIVIVLDTAVLGHLHVLPSGHRVNIVVVALEVTEEGGVELRVSLIIIVPARVEIVSTETYTGILVDIRGEIGSQSVLPVFLRTAFVVLQVGQRALGVGEQQVAGLDMEIVIRLDKQEVARLRPVQEMTGQTWGTQVTEDVVFTPVTIGAVEVLEEMGEGVVVHLGVLCAQALINAPLFVFCRYKPLHLRGVAPPGAALQASCDAVVGTHATAHGITKGIIAIVLSEKPLGYDGDDKEGGNEGNEVLHA